jgi:hypothetical protein
MNDGMPIFYLLQFQLSYFAIGLPIDLDWPSLL